MFTFCLLQTSTMRELSRGYMVQDPFLDGHGLTTYISPRRTKPGAAGPSQSFSKWQKGGVRGCIVSAGDVMQLMSIVVKIFVEHVALEILLLSAVIGKFIICSA